jgi:hypothetical protein
MQAVAVVVHLGDQAEQEVRLLVAVEQAVAVQVSVQLVLDLMATVLLVQPTLAAVVAVAQTQEHQLLYLLAAQAVQVL